MATDYWKADGQILDQIEELIREHHPDLVECIGRILVLFRDPGAKEGGLHVLGKHGKVTDRQNAVGETDYIFYIELNNETWASDLDTIQKEALLFHHLSGMGVEVTDKGVTKYVIRPPDVVGFREEFERYGIAWRPKFEEDPLPPDLEVTKTVSQKGNGSAEPIKRLTAADLPSSVRADIQDLD